MNLSTASLTHPRSHFQHIALVGKRAAPVPVPQAGADQVLAGVAAFLQAQGCRVSIEAQTAQGMALPAGCGVLSFTEIGQQCDLAIAVGGDGTMLGMGRQLAQYGLPLVGINQGRLGFITDIALENYAAALSAILAGEFDEDQRSLMQAQVLRAGAVVFEATAMNDVVVNRGSTAGMLALRIEVNGRFVANQRADGLIVATPTGSTAYALSAGGPILHPGTGGWVMVPIAPHVLSNRPIVLPQDSEVVLELVSGAKTGEKASANFDMQSLAELEVGDRVVVRRAAHGVRFLHPKGWSYFDILRQKLHWNAGIGAGMNLEGV